MTDDIVERNTPTIIVDHRWTWWIPFFCGGHVTLSDPWPPSRSVMLPVQEVIWPPSHSGLKRWTSSGQGCQFNSRWIHLWCFVRRLDTSPHKHTAAARHTHAHTNTNCKSTTPPDCGHLNLMPLPDWLTCNRLLLCWSHVCRHARTGHWWCGPSGRGSACVWPADRARQWAPVLACRGRDLDWSAERGLRGRRLTNFSVQGKSKSLTKPKSSPVTTLRPPCDTHAQLTSARSEFRGHTPKTSSPRMLRGTRLRVFPLPPHKLGPHQTDTDQQLTRESWLCVCVCV